MLKMLLASTALTALVATSAFAQSTTTTTDTGATAATTETNAATDTKTMADTGVVAPGPTLASDIIGSAVYESSAQDAKSIGDINDVVISPEGEVASVIIGVGGFLGIGEKDVEVEYSSIEWADRDGQRWLVANMTRQQLEAAPDFDRSTIYSEAKSEPPALDTAQNTTATGTETPLSTGVDPNVAADTDTNMAADADTNVAAGTEQPAEETTAERVENGDSAVAPAEEQAQAIDRSTMTVVTVEDLTADNLMGRTVYGGNDENIGEISDVLLTADNKVEGFVLDVGGFLGMGEKPVAISPEQLEIMADANGELSVFTPFTKAELEAHPEYSKERWDAERDSMILTVPSG